MNKEWIENQLKCILAGTSIFKHIPEAIGNVLYCDTSQPNEMPMTEQQARSRKIKSIAIGAIALSLIWAFLYSHYIWATILSALALYICYVIYDTTFSGTDYFMGEKGFAIVSFKDQRDNITKEEVVLFDELSNFFTGEIIKKQNYSYAGTDYYFSLYKKPENEVFDLAYHTEGSYNEKSPKDPMRPSGASFEYLLMKVVEKQWTLYFFNAHRNEPEVSFSIIKDESMYSDVITIGHDYIDVYGTRYNQENTKRIYFSNGNLVIEHMNHKKKLFGFIEEGDKSVIPLSYIGNRQAFLMLFESFYSK